MDNNILLVKVDNSGNVVWAKTYSYGRSIGGSTTVTSSPQGILLTNLADSGGNNASIMNVFLNLDGSFKWASTFGGDAATRRVFKGNDVNSPASAISGDGGAVFANYANLSGKKHDFLLVKTDDAGRVPGCKYINSASISVKDVTNEIASYSIKVTIGDADISVADAPFKVTKVDLTSKTMCQPAPFAPKLLFPQDNETIPAKEMKFSWSSVANAEQYEIQISTKKDFSTLSFSGKEKTNKITLTANTYVKSIHYWRVRGLNGAHKGSWSKVGTFMLADKVEKTVVITLKPDNPYMFVNGAKKEIDPGRGTKPVIIPKWGRTVVPIRAVVEALGGTIGWDGAEKKVTVEFNERKIELRINNPKAKVNGKTKWIDMNNHNVKPIIVNSRTMLPLRFVAESLGCSVGWDSNTRTITITFKP